MLSRAHPVMHWADDSRGAPYAKDPSVVFFGGRYLMYFSVPPRPGETRWGQAVAASVDLLDWQLIGEIDPQGEAEATGICAGGAIVLGDRVHLFYQTYGRGRADAICHASSTDGLTFERSPDNPVIRPAGDWTCGRAIDAEAYVVGDELFCYWATRDQPYRYQKLGRAQRPADQRLLGGQLAAALLIEHPAAHAPLGEGLYRGADDLPARRHVRDVLRRRVQQRAPTDRRRLQLRRAELGADGRRAVPGQRGAG